MSKQSWKDDNTLNKYKENFIKDIDALGDRISKAIKHNSDFIAYIFLEKIEDYIWDNYNIDEIENLDLNDIVYKWFYENYD